MKAYAAKNQIKELYRLSKPERTLTNTLTAVAGFLLASQGQVDWGKFLFMIIGLTLVIASANALNNYIDRDIDRLMSRTKDRALATGRISFRASLIFAVLLVLTGFGILSKTNLVTVLIIGAAYFFYVVVYGYAKRRTVHSTLIGTIPGGASLVAGYTAVAGQLNATAAILFLIMLSWQMVHFYAIGIFRLKDYNNAKLPILPVKKSIYATKVQMLAYLALFIFSTSLLFWYGDAGFMGYTYFAAIVILGGLWLWKTMGGLSTKDDELWARDVFKFSLIVLLGTSAAIAFGPTLP